MLLVDFSIQPGVEGKSTGYALRGLSTSPLISPRTHRTCRMAPGDMATHTHLDVTVLAQRSFFQLGGTLGPLYPRTFLWTVATSVS